MSIEGCCKTSHESRSPRATTLHAHEMSIGFVSCLDAWHALAEPLKQNLLPFCELNERCLDTDASLEGPVSIMSCHVAQVIVVCCVQT